MSAARTARRDTLRIGATSVVVLIAAMSLYCVTQAVPQGAAPLRVVPAAIDIGAVVADSTRSLQFILFNTGDEAVRLRYIHSECDCTMQVPESGLVPARGQFVLQATLILEGLATGLLDETITILTDQPGQPELNIPVTAYVANHWLSGETGGAGE